MQLLWHHLRLLLAKNIQSNEWVSLVQAVVPAFLGNMGGTGILGANIICSSLLACIIALFTKLIIHTLESIEAVLLSCKQASVCSQLLVLEGSKHVREGLDFAL